MKNYILITSLFFILISCGTNKDAINTSESGTTENVVEHDENEQDEPSEDEKAGKNSDVLITDGIIRDKSSEGCGFVIQMMVDANTPSSTFYEPLTLPEANQREGKSIRIEYRLSRRPSTCNWQFQSLLIKY